MFRTATADIERPAHVMSDEPIPLSVLALDLEPPSTGGWEHHLLSRGVLILVDDLGRKAVSRSDARRLFSEKHENEVRQRKHREAAERAAEEADRLFRASLPRGLSWLDVPDGASPAEVWRAADLAAQPKRKSLLEEAFDNEPELTFHPLPEAS